MRRLHGKPVGRGHEGQATLLQPILMHLRRLDVLEIPASVEVVTRLQGRTHIDPRDVEDASKVRRTGATHPDDDERAAALHVEAVGKPDAISCSSASAAWLNEFSRT
jgi:hypothetical protein